MGLVLAFDTATNVATSALVEDGVVLGERASQAVRVLADAHALLADARRERADLKGVVVGTGPGSFTGVRIGLAAARGLSLALEIPVAGVSTLRALAAGAPGVQPVIDARRREVFALVGGEPTCLRPDELPITAGTVYVGDGALRYREILEARGAVVPARESSLHVPRARLHAELAASFGPAELVEPVYLRLPDAEKALARS